jgi:hypothetical protein
MVWIVNGIAEHLVISLATHVAKCFVVDVEESGLCFHGWHGNHPYCKYASSLPNKMTVNIHNPVGAFPKL